MMDTLTFVGELYLLISSELDERTRRHFLGGSAELLGRGSISAIARSTGVSRHTVSTGLAELCELLAQAPTTTKVRSRIRRPGGGRKSLVETDPTLLVDLEKLIEPTARGDPESSLRWTCKSVRHLANELQSMGHSVSPQVVADLLHSIGYSLQANSKVLEGSQHPDRNAQFGYINALVAMSLLEGQPVISVDTKKKELVGEFKNGGREWRPSGEPEAVNVHDFGKVRASPYGIYDLTHDLGWVSVGVDHDTSAFAVQTIRQWWSSMGSPLYPAASQLMITADGGGSNGSRVRLWKLELQKLADETGLNITVCHLPPGTSKWNKIEHKLFSYITMNWRAHPLTSHEVIVNLIASTRTSSGLMVRSELDTRNYPAGIKVSNEEMDAISIRRHEFHGEWNYTISPRLEDR